MSKTNKQSNAFCQSGGSPPKSRTRKPRSSSPAAPSVPIIPENAIFITARELAGLLRKSLKSIYRLADKKAITHVRDAGGLLFSRDSVNEYLAARLVPKAAR
jgi:excisionase family DNA binding protein